MDATIPTEVMKIERKIYSGLPARAIKLLGSGCTQVESSRALGVSESQVSQWMAEPDFQSQVNDEVKKNFARQSQVDENYNEIEQKLSKKLLEQCEYIFDADKALRILKFANEAKRKLAPQTPQGEGGNGTTIFAPVTLIMPGAVAREFILNPNNEVVGIDGTEVITLPSKNMETLAQTVRASIQTSDKNLKQLARKNGTRQQDPWSDL